MSTAPDLDCPPPHHGVCDGVERSPSMCRCDCAGCKHNCGAHDEAAPAWGDDEALAVFAEADSLIVTIPTEQFDRLMADDGPDPAPGLAAMVAHRRTTLLATHSSADDAVTTPEYECPDCHRMWQSQAARDGCCTWDDA